MFDEEERPKKTVRLFTPAKLEGISVEEMREYVAELKLEAVRVEAEIDKRLSHATAAASLFKKA